MKDKLKEVLKHSALNLSFDETFSAFILNKADYYSQKELIEHD